MARKAFAFLALLLVSPAIISAATITVGDSNGWGFGVNYAAWARGQTFSPGDTLVFNYGASHSVAEVSRSDYDTCNSGNPVNLYPSSSPTSIPLSTGTRYFICPTPGHCSQGMRLVVTVSGGSSGSAPSESPSNTPSPTSPPPAGNAATTLGGWSGLIHLISCFQIQMCTIAAVTIDTISLKSCALASLELHESSENGESTW